MKGRVCLLGLCVPGVNARPGLLEHCDYVEREGKEKEKERGREGRERNYDLPIQEALLPLSCWQILTSCQKVWSPIPLPRERSLLLLPTPGLWSESVNT